ncbi:MAG: antiterminator LoaP [Firmicutes bacterium]|nr:antiterminator LoaP [Bacillota bacterium]
MDFCTVNWYIMSVRTGKENSVVRDIKAYNAEKGIKNVSPFIPMKERFFKKGDCAEKERKMMFPGYVFAETPMGNGEFWSYARGVRWRYENPIEVLSYGDSGEYALRMEERITLMQLMNHEWCVSASVGFKENGRTKIISGPLRGFEAQIKKVDRYKMKASVELDMHGRKMLADVGLEVLDIVKK